VLGLIDCGYLVNSEEYQNYITKKEKLEQENAELISKNKELKAKIKYYVGLGKEAEKVIKSCGIAECCTADYATDHCSLGKLCKMVKGVAENDVLREGNSNRQALHQQEKS